MNDADLAALLAAPESDRVERKEAFTGTAKERVYEAICAFANDYPRRGAGVIVIGQRDDGTFAGLTVDDRLLSELAQIPNNTKILPRPSVLVSRHVVEGKELAVIVVEPSSSPPVRYDGRTWIRVGPTRALATLEQEVRLRERRQHLNVPFDIQPLPFVPLSAIDSEYFRTTYLPTAVSSEILQANHREPYAQMIGLRMLDPDRIPTTLGVLMLAVDPQWWVQGSFVQFLRFGGSKPSSTIVDQREVTGRIVEVIRRVEEIFQNNIRIPIRFADVEIEERSPEYPIAALRQIFRNAVMHRAYDGTNAPIRIHWYADRIEIDNPGGPYGRVTRENFGTGVVDYRNLNLAAALRDLGLVQRYGRGLDLAAEELARNGNPPLTWELSDTTTIVRLWRRP